MTSAAKHRERSHRSHKNSVATARMFMSNGYNRNHGKVKAADPYKAIGLTKGSNIFQRIMKVIKQMVSGFRKQDRGQK